jgi:hypothetical protein
MSQLDLAVHLVTGDSDSEAEEVDNFDVQEFSFLDSDGKKKKFSAQYVFLTYSKCPLFHEILTFINNKWPIDKAVASLELHEANPEAVDDDWAPESGEWPHSHWAIRFKKKIQVKAQTAFDVDGFHPNIQTIVTWGKTVNYCRKKDKDGKIQLELLYFNCDESNCLTVPSSKRAAPEPIDNLYELARSLRAEPETYFTRVRLAREMPRYAELAWNSVQNATRISTATDHLHPSTEPGILRLVSPRLQHMQFDHDLPYTLVVLGPPGCGKSFWAAKQLNTNPATTPCLRIGKKDKWTEWDLTKYKSILFDELDAVNEKYSSGVPKWTVKDMIACVEVKGGMDIDMRHKDFRNTPSCPRIWTCTHAWPFVRDYQIARRCRFINLYFDDPELHWTRSNPDDQGIWTMDDLMVEIPQEDGTIASLVDN